jgi:hypothetical protein
VTSHRGAKLSYLTWQFEPISCNNLQSTHVGECGKGGCHADDAAVCVCG